MWKWVWEGRVPQGRRSELRSLPSEGGREERGLPSQPWGARLLCSVFLCQVLWVSQLEP